MLKKSFSDFDLSGEMRRAVAEMGFEEATPIQSLAIEPVMAGHDVIGQAQTGTGKTAAFGIPIIERIKPDTAGISALILCPTRELAVQIAEELKLLAKHKHGIRILAVYGGQPIERQITALQKGVHIVAGTPGRILDHMERGTLVLDQVRTAVLDEADKMLDMGFIDDVRCVLARLPEKRQTLLFSATISEEILKLSQTFQLQPEFIKVTHEELTVPSVEQIYFTVKEQQKTEILARLIDLYDWKLTLVFCNTKRRVDELVGRLQGLGCPAVGLHGDMRQTKRDSVMAQFRGGRLKVLVATDVAARGLDIEDIETVVNYDVPLDEENYVHRIGRTARAGKSGLAVTLAAGKEQFQLAEIIEFAKTQIEWRPVPTGRVKKSRPDRPAANVPVPDAPLPGVETARLHINAGKRQRIRREDIVAAITATTDLSADMIGAVKVFDRFSFLEVPRERAAGIIEALNHAGINGRAITVSPARARNGQESARAAGTSGEADA